MRLVDKSRELVLNQARFYGLNPSSKSQGVLPDGLENHTPVFNSERLSDSDKIPVRVNDGKFPHSPGLVFEGLLSGDAFSGQLGQNRIPVKAFHVRNSNVATRRRLRRAQFAMSEKVELDCAPR